MDGREEEKRGQVELESEVFSATGGCCMAGDKAWPENCPVHGDRNQ